MKNFKNKSSRLWALLFVVSASQANGLMDEMMLDKYKPSKMVAPLAQEKLNQVKITEESHQNGGLAKQMQEYKPKETIIDKEKRGVHLEKIKTVTLNISTKKVKTIKITTLNLLTK